MKVRVGDLRQWAKEGSKEVKLPLELKDRNGKDVTREVKIKQYLTIEEKLELLYLAYSVSINSDLGETTEGLSAARIYGINYYRFHITYTVYLIKHYTDVSLPENVVDAYNLIKEIGLDNLVISEIPQSELDELEDIKHKFLETKANELNKQTDIAAVVHDFFSGIIDKLPNENTINKYMDMLQLNE